jgi:hypothetical protein
MQQLKSSDQTIYNNLEFNFLQVVAFTGNPQLKLDGTVFDVLGYQWWKQIRSRPYRRIELIPAGGTVTVIVGDLDELAGISNVATPQVVGAAADGAAATGNPVLVAGKDPASGFVTTFGVGQDGVAFGGGVLTIGGKGQATGGGGGTTLKPLYMDTSGRARVVGAADDGTALASSPVFVGGRDAANNVQALPVCMETQDLPKWSGLNRIFLPMGVRDGTSAVGRPMAGDASGRAQVVSGEAAVVLANAVTSPAAASTVVGATVDIAGFSKVSLAARIRGGTGGTLDVYIQSGDGTNWWDVAHFTQLAAAAVLVAWGLSLERGGGATIVSINTADGTPSLVANTKVTGLLGNKLRYVFVAGAGTSAGGSQDIRGWGSA